MKMKTIYDFSMEDIKGKKVQLKEYEGKVALIVNVASRCGYTPQYNGLQKLYEKFNGKGFVVLGFPSNEFAAEEPGSNEEILKFCESKYNITFPLFAKTTVLKEKANPLYKFLTENQPIKWNFEKFLVDRGGNVVKRYDPTTEPEEIEGDVEELL